jgi:hypothetical protein
MFIEVMVDDNTSFYLETPMSEKPATLTTLPWSLSAPTIVAPPSGAVSNARAKRAGVSGRMSGGSTIKAPVTTKQVLATVNQDFIEKGFGTIKTLANGITNAITGLDVVPEEYEATFTVNFGVDAEANAKIIVAAAKSAASVTIRLKWAKP